MGNIFTFVQQRRAQRDNLNQSTSHTEAYANTEMIERHPRGQ